LGPEEMVRHLVRSRGFPCLKKIDFLLKQDNPVYKLRHDTPHYNKNVTLSMKFCIMAKCYAECHYAECRK